MRIHEALANAARFAASRRQAASLEDRDEQERLWRYVRGCRDFLYETGQVYRFEDYLEEIAPKHCPFVSAALDAHKGTSLHQAMEMLLEVLDEAPAPEQKQHALVLIALLDFIADTGQADAVADYFNHRPEQAPLAIAHFETREEAEAWMQELEEPPSPVSILIGDEYHLAWYSREDNARGMYRDYILEPHLEGLTARGIPPGTPSFGTRAEAEAWLANHPASPFAFVSISGEDYLAVHHQQLKRHTLHQVASTLNAWEERKQALALQEAQETATPDGD